MNSPETVFPQSVLLDDADEPLAVAGQAPAVAQATRPKKRGMPAWAFLAIGGFVLVAVVGVLAAILLGKNRPAVPSPEPMAAAVVQERVAAQTPQSAVALAVPQSQPGQAASTTASPTMLSIGAPDQSALMTATPPSTLASPTAASGTVGPTREEFDALAKRVDALEDQTRSMVEAIAGQPAGTRRILAERMSDRSRRAGTTDGARIGPIKGSKPVTYNPDFAVTAVVGTRAWIRPVSATSARDLCVAKGDEVANSRVIEVNAAGRYVVLANGAHIQ